MILIKYIKLTIPLFLCLLLIGCNHESKEKKINSNGIYLKVLGTIQDGGIPHLGCNKKCCKDYFKNGYSKKRVVSLGISDLKEKKNYLIEASPDISFQLNNFLKNKSKNLNGIFITHAHIGHYSGLTNLGREVLNSSKMPLFLMPKMTEFISTNGPWDQLVKLKNVDLKKIFNEKSIELSEGLSIIPFKVPHRDEYSETVGFKIIGPKKIALFIPDIDKWDKWDKSIKNLITEVDYAFLDGTFYDSKEINNRDISEIPHPFIIESLELFKDLKESDRNKIYYIHLNHTNPLLNFESEEYQNVVSKGYNVATEGLELEL
ncbi:MBL fold metallo-hydrolase [Flavobacteriaceae bacterium]|nr:MBL fold metallo-hydrolase [Flavobacteriaceae bacterium]MDB4050733.1 MBL fold metallo-hydrolase [Flavobacteriaceae bacterium]MDB4087110.1 MBL fold metallo-hydrolase [Flavobacteriaceae bacterium]MDB4239393.1 MBL fold metallo-hydrolase [Flavobacteriaceae bacterium]